MTSVWVHISIFYSVLQLNDITLYGFKILCLHSSVIGHLVFSTFFSIVDNAAMNIQARKYASQLLLPCMF